MEDYIQCKECLAFFPKIYKKHECDGFMKFLVGLKRRKEEIKKRDEKFGAPPGNRGTR